jgi:hypothetical protein
MFVSLSSFQGTIVATGTQVSVLVVNLLTLKGMTLSKLTTSEEEV